MPYQSGEYPQPLLRTQILQAPMVSGYATIRLRADSFLNTSGLDDTVLVQFENVSTGASATSFTVQLQQTSDPSSSGLRTNVGSAVTVNPGGRKDATFFPSQQFLEFTSTSGAGELRAQMSSRLAWSQMAFSKSDPFYPPQLWQVVGGKTWAQLANTGS